MKERVVDRRYDPLVWLGRKIFRRDELEEPMPAHAAHAPRPRIPDGPSRPPFGPPSGQPATSSDGSATPGDVDVHTPGTPFTGARRGEAPELGPDGRLDISELTATHQGGLSPFGSEQEFPLPLTDLNYSPPSDPGSNSHNGHH
jgi:succinate dehydrogenase / fumarate reductase iron-sulfur subunit